MRILTLLLCIIISNELFAQFMGPRLLCPGQPNLSEGFVSFVDLDNDGRKDILWSGRWSGNGVGWYRNSCTGFLPSTYIDNTPGISTCSIAFDDDNDGQNEVFASDGDYHTFYRYENLGNGTFSVRDTIASSIYIPLLLYPSDMDLDGDIDIICSGTYQVIWYENNGSGSYIAEHEICSGGYWIDVKTYDFNSDGKMDIIVGNEIYYQQSNGTFILNTTLNAYHNLISIHIVDIDFDGDMDIIGGEFSTNSTDGIKFFINDNGVFTLQTQATIPFWDLLTSSIGDIDNDGDIDIVAGGWSPLYYYENIGNLNFNPHILPFNGDKECIQLGEIDNDGDLDFVVATGILSRVFINNTVFTAETTISLTLCPGDSLFAQGDYQTNPGVYSDTLSAVNGCDSLIVTHLLPETNTINYSICSGDSVYFSGAYHHIQGVFYDSLTAASGCDSITINNLTIRNHSTSSINAEACNSFTINGQVFTTSGTYTQIIPNSVGCDSTIILTLTILHSTNFIYNETSCDDIVYNGITYNTTGTYTQVLTNSDGCDSIITLNLIINKTFSTLNIESCDNVLVNGINYNTSGQFTQVLINSVGCDSIMTLNISILSFNTIINEIACDSFSLNGISYNSSGVYQQLYTNMYGCDSIFTLNLNIVNTINPIPAEPVLEWANRIGGSVHEYGNSIMIDAENKIYVTGSFGGTVDFDPGPGVYNLIGSSNINIFVLKLNKNGTLVWAKVMGGVNGCSGKSLAIDSNGNIYVTGNFGGTVDFDPGAGTYNLTSAGSTDVFISKLDSLGNFVWAKQMGGANEDEGNSLSVDSSGNVYTIGYFTGTVDFDPGPGTNNLTSAGSWEIFISKLNTSGNFVWARRFGSATVDQGYSIAVDVACNIYTTGIFSGTVDFNPGAGTNNLSASGFDVFISKLDSSGNFVWAKKIGGSGPDYGKNIHIDAANKIYVTGYFRTTVDFDPGTDTDMKTSAGGDDVFVLKLDSSGNYLWSRTFGSATHDNGLSIATDSTGNVYSSGFYTSTTDFDPGTGINNLTSNGSEDIFISKYDACGNFKWVRSFGASSSDKGNSIIVNNKDEIFTTGYFTNTIDFDPGPNSFILTSFNTYYDLFIQKLANCSTTTSTVNVYGCNSYLSPSGNHTWTVPGTYIDTIANNKGCDSIITIHLTMIAPTYNSINVSSCDNYLSPSGNYLWSLSNIYNDTILNVAGCDSIITINLHLLNSTTNTLNIAICNNYVSPSGNYIWSTTGIYNDTISNTIGCDSIITINLTILNSDTLMNIDTCNSFSINSQTYTSSGIYSQILTNQAGCDSTITINLQLNNSSINYKNENACDFYSSPSGHYLWNTSGNYIDTIQNMSGCDSIININLTITNSTTSTINVSACNNFISPSGNNIWTTSGSYSDTIPNFLGCDSIITINLTIESDYFIENTVSICQGQSYIFNGHTYDQSGIYYDTLHTIIGCDSIFATNLNIVPLPNAGISASDTSCSFVTELTLLNCLNGNPDTTGFWSDDDNSGALLNGIFNPSIVGSDIYHFTYTVSGIPPCSDAQSNVAIFVDICNVIEDGKISEIIIFPNPTKNIVYIISDKTIYINVFNLIGEKVFSGNTNDCNYVSIKQNGVYFFELSDEKLKVYKKIVVQ